MRTGLVHVASVMVGTAMPQELQTIAYKVVLMELSEGDGAAGYHALLQKLLVSGVPLVLCGHSTEMQFIVQAIRHTTVDEPFHMLDILLYRRCPEGRYLFLPTTITIVSKDPLKFRVCSVSSCVPFPSVLFSGIRN